MFCCLLPAFTSDSQACRIRFGKIEPSGRICGASIPDNVRCEFKREWNMF
jgi:hypothetical protein